MADKDPASLEERKPYTGSLDGPHPQIPHHHTANHSQDKEYGYVFQRILDRVRMKLKDPTYMSHHPAPISYYRFTCYDLPDSQETPIEELFTRLRSNSSKHVLLVGHVGVGKSTMAKLLSAGWKNKSYLSEYDLVLNLPLKECATRNMKSFQGLCDWLRMPEHRSEFENLLKKLGKRLLIILDGWESLVASDSNWMMSVFTKIIKRQALSESTVIVTSRPSGISSLIQFTDFDLHLQLTGFTSDGVLQYFSNLTLEGLGNKERLLEYIVEYQEIRDLCHIPTMCDLLTDVYKTLKFALPSSVTQCISMMAVGTVRRELCGDKDMTPQDYELDSLSPSAQRNIGIASRLALADIEFELADNPGGLSYFCYGEDLSGVDGIRGGLVEERSVKLTDGHLQSSCRFMHPLIRQFLAAMALQKLPLVNQVKFFHKHSQDMVRELEPLCKFFFGLSKQKSSAPFSLTETTLPHIVDLLIHNLDIDDQSNVVDRLFLISCIHESEEPALWRKLASKHPDILRLQLGGAPITSVVKLTLAMMMANSGIRQWVVEAPESKKHVGQSLELLTSMYDHTSTVTVSIVSGPGVVVRPFVLKPVVRLSEPGWKRVHISCCKSLKDIFHRVLQLYSPIKIRSDCSDLGYMSFVSCDCLQASFTEDVCIEPIEALHWVPMPPRTKKQRRRGSEAEESHMEIHHQRSFAELILLSTPYPNGITFTLPVTKEEVIMKLYDQSRELSFRDGRIASEVREVIEREEELASCVEETARSGKTEMVVTGLLLPRKTNAEFLPNVSIQTIKPASVTEANTTMPLQPTQEQRAVPVHSTSTAVQQSQAGDKSKRQPVAWRPGTVIYTADPNIFPTDKIYPLPDESNLIRRGGNGQILKVDYEGGMFVAKKTTFRTREYQILVRVQHRNIIPLVAMMIGETHPVHRRRYYCYHFMPHMSGDCARMIVDHEQYTLRELRRRHHNNPRELGVMQGNMRYLLSEVLRGLEYLHSLNIVHRDLKASNILLKLWCTCEHPLQCSCTKKFTVLIADFDAACELDPSNHVLPTRRSETDCDVYSISPVGTAGFRSPEGSFLIIANDPAIIQPHLTPKADIWSFGVLLLRMFIWEDGPSSQRELAMLLLAFYQQRGMREGATRHRGLQLSHDTVQKLRKLPQLKDQLRGMHSAIDLVNLCLQVDPEARPSAAELLKHSFLY